MTTSFQSGRNIFIQEGQSPAEQRFGLNLMINVMSQNTDKEKRSKLDPNVHKIAEVLLITQTSMLLNKEQLITLWGAWNSDEISLKDKQLIINQLSGGTFSEKPVEEKSLLHHHGRGRDILFLMVLSRRRSPIKIVKITGQKLRPEQCPKDNSKDFWTD